MWFGPIFSPDISQTCSAEGGETAVMHPAERDKLAVSPACAAHIANRQTNPEVGTAARFAVYSAPRQSGSQVCPAPNMTRFKNRHRSSKRGVAVLCRAYRNFGIGCGGLFTRCLYGGLLSVALADLGFGMRFFGQGVSARVRCWYVLQQRDTKRETWKSVLRKTL